MYLSKRFTFNILSLIILCSFELFSQGTYYNSISTSSSTFINDLKTRIRIPYTKVIYDNFDETNITNFASINNGNGTKSVFCVYSNYEHIYSGTFTYLPINREHTFAHSWQPTNPSSGGDEYADQHHLFPTHQTANSNRDDHPFGIVVNPTQTFLQSKTGTNSSGQIVFEPRNEDKGDAARALLYMVIRYDGISGNSWTFDWLNNTRLPSLSEAPQDVATLLTWHKQDPPDKWEVDRNNYIQSIQQNRNPFVDHPEWVNYINFNNLTKYSPVYAAEPSNHITNLSISVLSNSITINWTDAASGSQVPSGYLLLAYNKDNYFIPIDGSSYSDDTNLSDGVALVNIPYASPDNYTFNNLSPNTTHYFRVYSFNGNDTERNYKTDGIIPYVNAITTGSTTLPNAWINEIHYDNVGADVNEFVEIIIPNNYTTPTELAKFSVVLYNGSGGVSYNSTVLSLFTKGVIDSIHGFTFYSFVYPADGLQNGSPDGIAIGYDGNLIQFLSYEGSFTAVGGIANGIASTDIGVSETGTTTIGSSLGLSGVGNKYSDFVWTTFNNSATRGALNVSQTFSSFTLNVTAFIEGLYNGSSIIPDTINVELRNGSSPFALVESKKILLNSSGQGSANYNSISDGTNYYIVVKHRNSIETWSKNPQQFSSGNLNYNFTSAAAQAYGDNLLPKNGKYCIYSGDVNQDGLVDISDLSMTDHDNLMFVTGYTVTDLTGDDLVDISDVSLVDNNNLNFITKSTPMTILLNRNNTQLQKSYEGMK